MKGIKNDDSVEISETALLDFLKKSPLPGHRDLTVSATIFIKKSVTWGGNHTRLIHRYSLFDKMKIIWMVVI